MDNQYEILTLINQSIDMKNIHNHPLLYCLPLDRITKNIDWYCNFCNSQNNNNISSFYCTLCDYDLCPNCISNLQLDQIKFYDYNSNEANNLKNSQSSDSFNWQKKFEEHSHLLTLIKKINKNYSWKCNKCSKNYQNDEASFYCSLCDYYLCRKCMEGKRVEPVPIKIIPQPYNDFQFKSFKILNEYHKNNNLLYSPLTIQILLGLLSNGLSGQSLEEIKKVFSFTNIQIENNSFQKILSSFKDIPLANLISCSFYPNNNFKQHISNYHACFSNKKEELNKFIHDKIGKIDKYFENQILFGMILISVLDFKQPWKKKFKECAFQKRFFEDNKEKNVKMMNLLDTFKYYKDSSFEMIEILHKNENLSSLILFPNKGVSLDNLISELTQEKFYEIYNKLQLCRIDLTLPKFYINDNKKINIQEMLKKIGINNIFNSYSSDFERIIGNSKNIAVSEVLQTNLIEIDEKGEEGNIFFMINQPSGQTKTLTINRPFILVIKNKTFEKGKEIIMFAKINEL